jgi:uncharacterized protein
MPVRNMTQDEVRELVGKGLILSGQSRCVEVKAKHGMKSDAEGLTVPTYDRSGLMAVIRQQFRINWQGVHGPSHWARVRHHALRLCTLRQGDLLVAELFAYLHDSQRENEWTDPLHGPRAADYAASLNGRYFELSGEQLDLLTHAARFHSDGLMHQNPTIQSCWDADRLDLGRVGIKPSKQYLSTYAHPFIKEAYEWSID